MPMTTFNAADAAYHTINATNTYADAFLLGVIPNSVQDELFAVQDYERRRSESNATFRDAYLTPASTKHIVDDDTQEKMEALSPQSNTIHDYQPQALIQRVDNDTVRSVDLGIDHLQGRKQHDDSKSRTAQRYVTMAAATGIMAATYTDVGLGITSLAATLLASGAATAYATHKAYSYHHCNYEATHPDSHLEDTFREDLLRDKTDEALEQVLERAVFCEANAGIKEQRPGSHYP